MNERRVYVGGGEGGEGDKGGSEGEGEYAGEGGHVRAGAGEGEEVCVGGEGRRAWVAEREGVRRQKAGMCGQQRGAWAGGKGEGAVWRERGKVQERAWGREGGHGPQRGRAGTGNRE